MSKGGGTPLGNPYRDVLLDGVRFLAPALNKVYNFMRSYSKQGMVTQWFMHCFSNNFKIGDICFNNIAISNYKL